MRKSIHLFVAAALIMLSAGEVRSDVKFGNNVSEIRAHGLTDFKGRSLVAFYVSAREAVINGEGQALHVSAVKTEPSRAAIGADGSAVVPKAFVPVSGFKAFNYIVFAVPSPDNQRLYLKNFDGTFPADSRLREGELSHLDAHDFAYERIWYMSLLEFKALQFSQGANDFVELDFHGRTLTSSVVYMRAPAPRTLPRALAL